MNYQAVFKRYELKYLITQEQKERVLRAMEGRMKLDQYGRSAIRNIYFDTETYRLIRRSLEKPAYKEKLRIRSYQKASPKSTVFVELKKKYNGIVYKRRLSLQETEALNWLSGSPHTGADSQIAREIDYFLSYYGPLRPTVFLTYEREAFYALDGGDFRVTFDENILCRREDVSLEGEIWGTPLLPEGMTLMEIKCSGGIPLWLTEVLSREKIRKTSFSKYGTAYETMIYPTEKGEFRHVQPIVSRSV